MTESLPEIRNLRTLLEGIPNRIDTTNAKRSAGPIIAGEFALICGAEDQFGGLAALIGSIERLPDLVREQFEQGGRQQAALAIVGRVRSIFAPKLMAQFFENFLSSTSGDREVVLSMLPLLEDIQFDAVALESKSTDIFGEIGELRSKLMKSDGLSHSSKVIVDAQLSLMERSISRFSSTGVGKFRDSIFSSMGRIVVELHTNTENNKAVVRSTIDDVLRIYGFMEVGGNLLTLAAPVAVKLLQGP